jgi:ATP-dependent helicase/nuclease subunit A
MAWTKQQKEALEISNQNVLVSAGAGSGKTSVLTQRIVDILQSNQAKLDEIIVLTFTNLAAFELRSRVKKKLKKGGFSQQTINEVDSANICTFDSFAIRFVKQYGYLINKPSDIGVIDSQVFTLLKKEMLIEIFDELIKNKSHESIIFNYFSKKDYDNLIELFLDLANKVQMRLNYNKYLDTYIMTHFNSSKLKIKFDYYVQRKSDNIKKAMIYLNNQLRDTEFENIVKHYDEVIKGIFNPFRLKAGQKAELEEYGLESLVKSLKNYGDELKEVVSLNFSDFLEQTTANISINRVFITVLKMFIKKVTDYKIKQNHYEFNDITGFLIELLKSNRDLKKTLRDKTKFIFVDEYQDTSDVQDEFIDLIENNNAFFVGDIKQSIYGFRNANPKIFLNRLKRAQNTDAKYNFINMAHNFRSSKKVIDTVNGIFSDIMLKESSSIEYTDGNALIFANNNYQDSPEKVVKHLYSEKKHNGENYSTYQKTIFEAYSVAKYISQIIEKKELITKEIDDEYVNVPVEYSDIAILINDSMAFDIFEKAFAYFNIPLQTQRNINIVDNQIINTVNALLQIIISFRGNIEDPLVRRTLKLNYLAVSRSYLFRDIYSDLIIHNAIVTKKYLKDDFMQVLKNISLTLPSFTNGQLINILLDSFPFYEKMEHIGEISLNSAVIEKIYSIASSFSDLGILGEKFIEYFDKSLHTKKIELDFFQQIDSKTVKLMTFHKSKGLEYPIVFLPLLQKKPNESNSNLINYNRDFGFAFTPLNLENRLEETKVPNLETSIVKNFNEGFENRERIRLLYVACTRAKQQLHFYCIDNENAVPLSLAKVNLDLLNNSRYFLDTIEKEYLDINHHFTAHEDEWIKQNTTNKEFIQNGKDAFKKVNIPFVKTEKHRGSLKVNDIISEQQKNNLYAGTLLHLEFEKADFNDVSSITNAYILNFLKQSVNKNITQAKIYKELAFIKNNVQGVIDLVCVYDDYIDIFDYKTSRISEEYSSQLKIYKDYIQSKFPERLINCYLYSIIEDKVVCLVS